MIFLNYFYCFLFEIFIPVNPTKAMKISLDFG